MKKFTTLMLSFLCIAALLTGCVESDIGVKLNADETGTISATIGIEEDFYDQLVEMGATVFEDKETTTYEHDGKTYISYAESTEYKCFEEIEQALLAMTYETDMFDDLESEDIPVEDDVADEETDATEEEPAPETDTHVFKSVEIEKNGGIFYTVYSFKAELNPQTAEADDESMVDMDIPMDDVFHMIFSIEMPAEITEASGGTVEGNKVTFEIDDITEAAEFSVNCEQSNIAAIVIIVIALVILLITFIICLNKRKNNG
ncbi:MAG: hypothetical protein J6D10_08945 [Clostridia bacterium]|nr:hypothetical protein [Clostridia bacterium]